MLDSEDRNQNMLTADGKHNTCPLNYSQSSWLDFIIIIIIIIIIRDLYDG